MESTRIHLLEKLSLCSIVLPYLPTHRSFLILSSFSSKSREMLEQNYQLFLRLMRRSCLNVAIRSTCLDKLWLPSDLFTFHVHNWLDFCEQLIKLLKQREQGQGYYFAHHYLHQTLSITVIFSIQLKLEKITN